MRTSVSMLTLTLSLVWAMPAGADLIRPRPLKCPSGSYKYTNHCGSICKQLKCKDDKGCRGGKLCRAVPLCIEKGLRHGCGRGGMRRGPDGKRMKYAYVKATGSCAKGKKCPSGSKCITAKRCISAVKKDEPPKPEPEDEKKPQATDEKKPEAKDEKKPEAKDKKKPEAKEEEEEEDEEEEQPKKEPKPTKPSGCSVASPSVGGGLLLVLFLGLRRRR